MKLSHLLYFGLMTLVIIVSGAYAGAVIKGNGVYQIEIDNAKFFGDDSSIYVEVYYGVRERILEYHEVNGVFSGNAMMKLNIYKDSVLASSKEWHVPHTLEDTSNIKSGKTLIGIETFAVPAGNYRVDFISYDSLDTSRRDSFSFPLSINLYPQKEEVFSDVELCTSISPSTDNTGIFYKNTLNVVPNASLLYGTGLPTLYYYTEAYNITASGNHGNILLKSTISDGSGKVLLRQMKKKTRAFNSIVENGQFDVSQLTGGTYVLALSLMDTLQQTFATVSKKFFIYQPGSVQSPFTDSSNGAGSAASSEYALMSEKDIDSEYTVSKYIVSEPERNIYKNLKDIDAKRKFMFDFWRRRNPDPGSTGNSYKIEYMDRVAYANENFTKAFRPGWKSDRGRVYIMFGKYDEVEQFPSSAESNPYEIWHYNGIEGGVVFVFVDRNDLGQFTLVHSTERNELHDENWYAEYAQKAK